MFWIQVGWCGLILMNLSGALQITQKPRFCSLTVGSSVHVFCETKGLSYEKHRVQWYKLDRYDETIEDKQPVEESERFTVHTVDTSETSILHIQDMQTADSGVYVCKIGSEWGPGSEIHVVRPVNVTQAEYRSKLKDGLMVLQGLLVILCTAAILLRKQTVFVRKDGLYEEPQTDHIYEGLAIETCGDLYEDLTLYCQAEGAEAPWE